MDIHRCRFVPYPPSAINAVAFSHSTQTKSQKSTAPLRLAIGRANGDIEIWDPLGGIWHHQTTLHGGKDRSIDGLIWVNEPDHVVPDGSRIPGKTRLFSIGYTSTITEWDLEKGCPRKQASGMHGDIWCLGAQPLTTVSKNADGKGENKPAQSSTKLVAGTIDGSLVLYSIEDDDLQFDRILVRSHKKKTKMVSIAFQTRNTFVVGCSDSAIRVYDIRNGQMISKMTLGSDLAGGAKEIIVWSVKCLNGRDIVSGDSTGQICIWDGKTYTQAQRLQSHKQDVLSLATSVDGETIISGGMDRKTVLYRKTRGSGERWGRVWHRRFHNHDVKTMASFEGHNMSIVVSGGPDASPVVMPLKEAGMEHHRTLSYLPQAPPVRSATKGRLIISWWDREVHVWRLRKSLRDLVDTTDADPSVSKNRKLLARILIKGEANITSASISDDGTLLFVATTSDIKAFYLQPRESKDDLKISKIEFPETISSRGANQIQISPDANWLSLVQNGNKPSVVRIVRDIDGESKPAIHPKAIRLHRIERKLPKHVTLGGLQLYDRRITHIAFSPDSAMLAMADLAGFIDTWILRDPTHQSANGDNMEEDEDVSSDESSDEEDDTDANAIPRWVKNPKGKLISRLMSAPTVLSFSNRVPGAVNPPVDGDSKHEADDYQLLAITAKPQVLLINPSLGSLTAWSRRNPVTRFPVEFRNIRDLVKGALWSGSRVWLYGNSFLFMLDLSQDIAEPEPSDPSSMMALIHGSVVKQGHKRKRGRDTGAGSKMEIGAAGPTRVLRHVEGEGTEELPLDGQAGGDPMDTDVTSGPGEDSDEDDSEAEGQGELALLRDDEGKAVSEKPSSHGLPFWHTYKYRPILGIVPLGDDESALEVSSKVEGHERPAQPLEVALIERPMWEVEMGDRYYADGE